MVGSGLQSAGVGRTLGILSTGLAGAGTAALLGGDPIQVAIQGISIGALNHWAYVNGVKDHLELDEITVKGDIDIFYRHRMAQVVSFLAEWRTPYVWGGSSSKGADCSGAVFYGIKQTIQTNFTRSTADGLFKSNKVEPITNPAEGDLMFYDYKGEGRIEHVTTLTGEGNMIHPSSGSGFIKKIPINSFGAEKTYFRRIIWSNF